MADRRASVQPGPSAPTRSSPPPRDRSPDSAYHSRTGSRSTQQTQPSQVFSKSSQNSSERSLAGPSQQDGPFASPELPNKPDPRFYSGNNQVPKIESLWGTVYSGQQNPDARGKEEHERNEKIRRKSKTVTDPVTGEELPICDAKYAPPREVEDKGRDMFPLEEWARFMRDLRGITVKYISFIVGCFIVLNGCFTLPYSFSVVLTFAAGVTWWRNLESSWQDFAHATENETGRRKSLVKGIAGNESVEWLNGTIAKLWPQINADLFASAVDLLEDVMQASLPSVVSEVKVANMGQGTTPIRIMSMRWLNGNVNKDAVPEDQIMSDQLAQGEWASLECSFTYRAQRSGASAASKAKNANLLIHFYVGVSGLIGKALPVWVELVQVTGTCRMKIQLVPDPPFIKLATFTFMGMPRLEVAAVPMNQHLFNVMNLPLISDFIYSSIKTAMGQYVAPASYTLDLSKILVGDDSKKDTRAIGVLVVHVRHAKGLKPADIDGKADPYVTLSYSKFAKPLWSTRIIFNELNPIWDETAIIPISTDELKAKERLSLELWDSDRFTADDICGRTEMEVTELVKNPGKTFKHNDKLIDIRGDTLPGTVSWDVVYYGKRPLNKALKTDGHDERMPKAFQHLDMPKSKKQKQDRSQDDDVCFIPPDRNYPSGILSIQIHNIVGLERHVVAGSKGDKAHQRGQGPEEEEEGDSLPSSYCSIMLDYQKVYKTRVKPMTSKPFFNAGCERFVRSWHNSTVLVVVRDRRMRESDPILGVVELRLKDVFKNSSHSCHFYPIRGGVGYGKIRISLLFRSIDAQLDPPLLGGDIGSLEISSETIFADGITDSEVRGADRIAFQTPLIRKRAVRSPIAAGWSPVKNTHGSTGFRLGVRHRHSSACVLYFCRAARLRRDKTLAVAVLWLKDIPDEQDVEVKLPVFRPRSVQQFIQNCGSLDEREGTHVGFVTLKVRFHLGLGHSHRRQAAYEKDFRDVMEAVSCVGHIRGEGPVPQPQDSSDSEEGSDNEEGDGQGEGEGRDSQRVHLTEEQEAQELNAEAEEAGEETYGIRGIKRKITQGSQRRQELHRKERGIMQWKGARTLAWVGRGVGSVPRLVGGKLKMEPRRPDVESEVRYMIEKLHDAA